MRTASRTRTLAVISLLVTVIACGPSEEEQAADRAAAIAVVEQFGSRLVQVNLGAGDRQAIVEDIRDTYGPYVTTLLLGGWLSDPSSAPGRESASPWPARIEVRDAVPLSGASYEVTGEILYVTSVDGDPVLRSPVRASVVRGPDDVWRISEWN